MLTVKAIACRVYGCDRPLRRGHGYCCLHLRRRARGSDMLAPIQRHNLSAADPAMNDWLRPSVRHVPLDGIAIERFISRIIPEPNSGCWLWMGGRDNGGGGNFVYGHRGYRCSRLAHAIFVGPVPDAVFVCHRCDNPACCNPAHLWLGTHKDNMLDMVKKGRQSRQGSPGSRSPTAKLTDDAVRLIRQDRRTAEELAALYSVRPRTIQRVRSGKGWRHIPMTVTP